MQLGCGGGSGMPGSSDAVGWWEVLVIAVGWRRLLQARCCDVGCAGSQAAAPGICATLMGPRVVDGSPPPGL